MLERGLCYFSYTESPRQVQSAALNIDDHRARVLAQRSRSAFPETGSSPGLALFVKLPTTGIGPGGYHITRVQEARALVRTSVGGAGHETIVRSGGKPAELDKPLHALSHTRYVSITPSFRWTF